MNGAGKKVVVVTNSSSYEPRAEWVGELFKQQGAQVLWVETDFIRREKVKRCGVHLTICTLTRCLTGRIFL